MYPDYLINGIDGREDRRIEAAEQFGIPCFDQLANVDEDLDCVFVCTSPLSHNAIIRDALLRDLHVFTELNLVPDGYQENMAHAKEQGKTLFLSSTFFYREEIRYIRSKISNDKMWNYSYHIGQYLPDWHPWESYKDFFVGNKRTNAIREIFAVQLPWILDVFGDVQSISSSALNLTTLDIDFPDCVSVLIRHKNGNVGVFTADVASRKAISNTF